MSAAGTGAHASTALRRTGWRDPAGTGVYQASTQMLREQNFRRFAWRRIVDDLRSTGDMIVLEMAPMVPPMARSLKKLGEPFLGPVASTGDGDGPVKVGCGMRSAVKPLLGNILVRFVWS